MRTIFFDYDKNALKMIDQRLLPERLEVAEFRRAAEVAEAIRSMLVRGAPAIGAAAAFGMALAAQEADADALRASLREAAEMLRRSRPTAVNLGWALDRILRVVDSFDGDADSLREAVLAEAQNIADEDVETNRRLAAYGASLIEEGDTIIHHCNTGALATVDWGTALGAIRMAHEQGKSIHVLVDETRPRLQGSRLTAWELQQYGIPFDIISDNAAGYFLRTGQAQKVFFGADRVAANGDVANKIGTYMLALAAKDNGVPAYSVLPVSTIDMSLASGEEIPIEERAPDEVLSIRRDGRRLSPEGASARNPAFDVTPARLITAIVTERGIVYPPFDAGLSSILREEQP